MLYLLTGKLAIPLVQRIINENNIHPNKPSTEPNNPDIPHPLFFESMVNNLVDHGYSVQANCLPLVLGKLLWEQSHSAPVTDFQNAGIGRNSGHSINKAIRTDAVAWITKETKAGEQWLAWILRLQDYLNQHLFLGLFSFESHFSLYKPDGFYKQHYDAFKGKSNRVLSLIVYLNYEWIAVNAGELVLHINNSEELISVKPEFGTLVVFLSEEIPHEVLATTVDRHSIAGWFSSRQML